MKSSYSSNDFVIYEGSSEIEGVATITALFVCLAASSSAAEPHLTASVPQYRIKLEPFVVPPTRTVGLVVKARINSGPVLRLLLDSGTQYVVLDRKAALKSGCSGGDDLDLVGAGAPAATVVKMQRAATVQVGDLALHNIPLLIEDRAIADGIQGAMPLSFFFGFLIRLDIPRKNLDLLPYPDQQSGPDSVLRSFPNNHLLFLKGTVNESRDGYFLLDTGASYNAISSSLARELNISDVFAERAPLQGGTAKFDAPLLRGSVRLRLG
jgi:Aspartyl protease